jgi:Sec-independent protein translocase protein TatA
MFGLGAQELLLILLRVPFFFGGEKLLDITKGLGLGLREFKRAREYGQRGRAHRAPAGPMHQQWKNPACRAVVDF